MAERGKVPELRRRWGWGGEAANCGSKREENISQEKGWEGTKDGPLSANGGFIQSLKVSYQWRGPVYACERKGSPSQCKVKF